VFAFIAKGQHWHWIPVDPDVLNELRQLFRQLAPDLDDFMFTVEVEQWVNAHERARHRKDPKQPASDQALMRMVWRVCKRAGVRKLSPHQLRHGFANRFLRESGRDVVALQALMGHSRPDTTQLYTDEVALDELAEALQRIADSRHEQASPELATLESDVAAALQAVEWRRRESNPRKISIGLSAWVSQARSLGSGMPSCWQIACTRPGPDLTMARHRRRPRAVSASPLGEPSALADLARHERPGAARDRAASFGEDKLELFAALGGSARPVVR
jgi:hypothetical protein